MIKLAIWFGKHKLPENIPSSNEMVCSCLSRMHKPPGIVLKTGSIVLCYYNIPLQCTGMFNGNDISTGMS